MKINLSDSIQSGNLGISLYIMIACLSTGYLLIYKQNWIANINRFREKLGLRYRLKTSARTNQIESRVLKIFGWIIMILGIMVFMVTLYYRIFS